ncbi:hypothetical protein Tco_0204129 [Tanacetum coccineum]
MKFKFSLPSGEECFEVAIEKFKLAGASENKYNCDYKESLLQWNNFGRHEMRSLIQNAGRLVFHCFRWNHCLGDRSQNYILSWSITEVSILLLGSFKDVGAHCVICLLRTFKNKWLYKVKLRMKVESRSREDRSEEKKDARSVDWLDPKSDVALNVLHQIATSDIIQDILEIGSPRLVQAKNLFNVLSPDMNKQKVTPCMAMEKLSSSPHKYMTETYYSKKHS